MKVMFETKRFLGAAGLAALLFIGVGLVQGVAPAQAAVPSNFDPGYIISDELFYDSNAMREDEIQAFLQARIGTCANGSCLNVLRTDTFSRSADAMCGAYAGAPAETTARILFKVQQACGISAKVLIVTLEKEQGLITNKAPSASKLDRAMGYACPDNTAQPGWCDPSFAGLYNQTYRAAWQLKRYGNPPGTSNYFTWYPVGQVSAIRYSTIDSCGSAPVRVANRATAALYYYTPYQPNSAALANMYGSAPPCGSYGNRNFWRMYTDWFGPTTLPAGSPSGEIKEMWTDTNTINLWGWALDPNVGTGPIQIHVLVDNSWTVLNANASNAASAAVFPEYGTNHGFGGTIAAVPGNHSVCVYAVNQGAGVNLPMTCRAVTVPDGSPVGELKDVTTSAETVSLWGWAADRDALTQPTDIHVSVNGAWTVLKANSPYPAPTAALRGVGANTGFGGTIHVPAGPANVCVFAVNKLAGSNTTLGCRNVSVADSSPVGVMKDVWSTPGGIGVWGWAADVDSSDASVDIHMLVDGAHWFVTHAGLDYAPGAGLTPDGGSKHGFNTVIPAGAGKHDVCAWAVNVGAGSNLALGCRSVTLPGGSPIGSMGDLWGGVGTIGMWGWALDLDTTDPIQVHVLIDQQWTVLTASAENAGVAAGWPGYGPNHGFGASITATPGQHQVCAYAVNVGSGSNTTLACRVVSVS
jgi:hypothetical protein